MNNMRQVKLNAGAFLLDTIHKHSLLTFLIIIASVISGTVSLVNLLSGSGFMDFEMTLMLFSAVFFSFSNVINIVLCKFKAKNHKSLGFVSRLLKFTISLAVVALLITLYTFVYRLFFSIISPDYTFFSSAFYLFGTFFAFTSLCLSAIILSFLKEQVIRRTMPDSIKLMTSLGVISGILFPLTFIIIAIQGTFSAGIWDFFMIISLSAVLILNWVLSFKASKKIKDIFTELPREDPGSDNDMKIVHDSYISQNVPASAPISPINISLEELEEEEPLAEEEPQEEDEESELTEDNKELELNIKEKIQEFEEEIEKNDIEITEDETDPEPAVECSKMHEIQNPFHDDNSDEVNLMDAHIPVTFARWQDHNENDIKSLSAKREDINNSEHPLENRSDDSTEKKPYFKAIRLLFGAKITRGISLLLLNINYSGKIPKSKKNAVEKKYSDKRDYARTLIYSDKSEFKKEPLKTEDVPEKETIEDMITVPETEQSNNSNNWTDSLADDENPFISDDN